MKMKQLLLTATGLLVLGTQAQAGGGEKVPPMPGTAEKTAGRVSPPPAQPAPTASTPTAEDKGTGGGHTAAPPPKEEQQEVKEEHTAASQTAASGEKDVKIAVQEDTPGIVNVGLSRAHLTSDFIEQAQSKKGQQWASILRTWEVTGSPDEWRNLVSTLTNEGHSLVRLSIENSKLTDADFAALYPLLKGSTNLEELDLTGNPGLTNKTGDLVKELIATYCPKLGSRGVELGGTGISSGMITAMEQETQKKLRKNLTGAGRALLTGQGGGHEVRQLQKAAGGLLSLFTQKW